MDIKLEILKLINESAVQENSSTLQRVIEQQNFDELAEEVVKFISFNFPVMRSVCDNCGKKEPMICQDCYAAEVFRTDE